MPEPNASVTVGVPIYNEQANLPSLLERLLSERVVGEVVAVDDWSTDRSPEILRSFASADARVRMLRPAERSGQLAGWVSAARSASEPIVVFIDGDALPMRGAIEILRSRLQGGVVAASGRVIAAGTHQRFPAARFRSNILHRVRALGFPKEAIIGRFFAVRQSWFLENVASTDIIANDAYLACLASRQGLAAVYEPSAMCLYSEATVTRDFAAQRQRADAGYAQLRTMGLLTRAQEPGTAACLRALMAELLADPIGGLHWIFQQVRAKFVVGYVPKGRDAGGWETQPTTKHRLQ